MIPHSIWAKSILWQIPVSEWASPFLPNEGFSPANPGNRPVYGLARMFSKFHQNLRLFFSPFLLSFMDTGHASRSEVFSYPLLLSWLIYFYRHSPQHISCTSLSCICFLEDLNWHVPLTLSSYLFSPQVLSSLSSNSLLKLLPLLQFRCHGPRTGCLSSIAQNLALKMVRHQIRILMLMLL